MLRDTFKNTYLALFQTGELSSLFSTEEEKKVFVQTFRQLLLLLGLFTIILILFHFFLQLFPLGSYVKKTPFAKYKTGLFFPWSKFYFPLTWFLYILVVGALRYLSLVIMAEKNTSFLNSMSVSVYSTLPLIISGLFLNSMYSLFPPISENNYTMGKFQLILALILFFGAIMWEGKIYISLGKQIFQQNTGRAFLTWFFPAFSFLVLFFLFIAYQAFFVR